MNKKSILADAPLKHLFSLGWKGFLEVLEVETLGFFGRLSCIWIKLVVIGYLAAPLVLLIAAVLPLPEYGFGYYLSLTNFVLYLLAAIPLTLIAFWPHLLVFAAQNRKSVSKN